MVSRDKNARTLPLVQKLQDKIRHVLDINDKRTSLTDITIERYGYRYDFNQLCLLQERPITASCAI